MENTTLDEKKERLEKQKARLVSKEQKIKALERKKELKKAISLGQLLIENGLDEFDRTILLGALLEIKDRSGRAEDLESWRIRAALHIEENKIAQSAVIVTFQTSPNKNIQSILKGNGLKWNPFRQEWQGYSHLSSLEESLKNCGANIQVVSLDQK